MADHWLMQDSELRFGRLQPPLRHLLKGLRRQWLLRWHWKLQELRKKRSGQLLRQLPESPPRRWLQFAGQTQALLQRLLQRLLRLAQERRLLRSQQSEQKERERMQWLRRRSLRLARDLPCSVLTRQQARPQCLDYSHTHWQVPEQLPRLDPKLSCF
jgi:hypothetical protein